MPGEMEGPIVSDIENSVTGDFYIYFYFYRKF